MPNPVLRICTMETQQNFPYDRMGGDIFTQRFIDLFNLHGWSLKEWSPSVPEPKGGGIFRSSPLTDGRRLAYRKMDNVTDTFNLVVSGGDQNTIINTIRELQETLEKATEYWTTNWQRQPVWIEARGSTEKEMRYAVIVDYRLTGFGSPYQQPFFGGCTSATEAILVIEHTFWQDTVPGEVGRCVHLHSKSYEPSVATFSDDTFYPESSASDATYCQTLKTVDLTSHYMVVGYDPGFGGGGKCEAGIVFGSVTIPEGAIIVNAVLDCDIYAGLTGSLMRVGVTGQNPVGGAINSVTVVNGGSGYHSPIVKIYNSMPGPIFREAIAEATVVNGVIKFITVIDGGLGYSSPTVVIQDSGAGVPGHGATATATATSFGVEAAVFDGTKADFMSRPRTNAQTGSPMTGGWPTAGVNVTQIVKEILECGYWTSGDNLAFFLTKLDTGDGSIRFYSWDEDSGCAGHCPSLYISWYTTEVPVGHDVTCAQEVYVANKQSDNSVNYIFYEDVAPVDTYSSNLFGADYSTPKQILPSVPGANDVIYFGSCPITAGDTRYGPFCSLVFDISTLPTNILTGAWEYWNGAWEEFLIVNSALNEICGDDLAFGTLGVTSIVWKYPDDWAETTVNSVTGYWVRYHVHTVVANATPPYQQNRDIYTIKNPYIDIDGSDIPGDIPALAKVKFASAACQWRSPNTIVMGLRSLSRGTQFNAYLNASDVLNYGIDFSYNSDESVSLSAFSGTPTGKLLDLTGFTPLDGLGYPIMTEVCHWELTGNIAPQYIGVYHAFVRCFHPAGAGVVKYRIKSIFGEEFNTTYSDIGGVTLNDQICAVDLGYISIVPSIALRDFLYDNVVKVKIYLESDSDDLSAGYSNSYVYDIILMPADEWSGNFGMPQTDISTVITYGSGVEIDSISTPRQYRVIETIKGIMGQRWVAAEWSRIASSEPIFQTNSDQRLWFFQYKHGTGLLSFFENSGAICAERSARYLLMRGET